MEFINLSMLILLCKIFMVFCIDEAKIASIAKGKQSEF